MKKIKKLMIIILLVIIIVGALIVLLKKLNQKKEEGNISVDNGEEVTQKSDEYGYVELSDYGLYYSINDILSKYVNLMTSNEVQDIEDEGSAEYTDSNQNMDIIYSLLDKNYVKNYNISVNNVKNVIYKLDDNAKIIPINIKIKYGENINTCIVNTYIIGNNVEEKKFIVRLDNKNETFSIEFVNNDDIEYAKIINDDTININEYNHFDVQIATNEQIAMNYLEQYKNLAENIPQIVYDNYLDDSYKELRFGSLEEYMKYIEDNKLELESIRTDKYLCNDLNDGKMEYVCKDQYDNVYVFDINSIFDYKIKLDNYTILTDKFKTEYQSANDNKKVQMNTDRFIQMLNRHDYKSSYNCISKEFKDNYFSTEDEFIDFIKQNFFDYNDLNFGDFSKEGANLFKYSIKIEDLTGNNEDGKNVNMIMQLNNDFDFEIAFEMLV